MFLSHIDDFFSLSLSLKNNKNITSGEDLNKMFSLFGAIFSIALTTSEVVKTDGNNYAPNPLNHVYAFILNILFICLFLERGEGREEERERNINVWLPLMCTLLGTWPATQAGALTGNRTGNSLIHRLAFNSLSHTSWGLNCV